MIISYSKQELDCAAKFILKNNSFSEKLGLNLKKIKQHIIDTMYSVAASNDIDYSGTLGYTVIADRSHEGFENDTDRIYFNILVDPSLGMSYNNSDFVSVELDF